MDQANANPGILLLGNIFVWDLEIEQWHIQMAICSHMYFHGNVNLSFMAAENRWAT